MRGAWQQQDVVRERLRLRRWHGLCSGFRVISRTFTILVGEAPTECHCADDALLIERAFHRIGLTNPLQVVEDGAEVINYLGGHGRYADRDAFPFPRILFIELKMAGASGFEVLEWLREHPECSVTPTIVLTSSGNPEDVKRAYDLGAHCYLVKPNSLEALEEMLRITYEFWSTCRKPPLVHKVAEQQWPGR